MDEDTPNDERFDQAMEMLDSLLDHIRMIEGTVFNYEEPMDEHLTHLLFYSATRLHGEEFARGLMDTAELAIEMANKHEAAEENSRKEDPVVGDVKGDAHRVYH